MSENLEFEEISSDEVDRVIAALEELAASVSSQTIQSYLEECSNNIYYLVYEDLLRRLGARRRGEATAE